MKTKTVPAVFFTIETKEFGFTVLSNPTILFHLDEEIYECFYNEKTTIRKCINIPLLKEYLYDYLIDMLEGDGYLESKAINPKDLIVHFNIYNESGEEFGSTVISIDYNRIKNWVNKK